MNAGENVLVVDDERDVGELIVTVAEALGLTCTAVTDPEKFLMSITPATTGIIMDLMMPEVDGVELLRLLAHSGCKSKIILMSGIGKRVIETAARLAEAHGLNVVGYLQKPFTLLELEHLLKQLAGMKPLLAKPSNARKEFKDEELERAIERDEFEVYYQPQIELAGGSLIGVEALVRWAHPTLGIIPPDAFISRLERLGLITSLTWLVASRSLRDIRGLADSRGVVPRLSLNASAQSLRDLSFPDKLLALIKRHGVAVDGITLELTESGLLEELPRTLDVLTRLRMKEVRISIDDFGTGYAMMTHLSVIPAVELKIDRSFIQNSHLNDGDRVMVEKCIEIGHALGMSVVAEGVEQLDHLEFLRRSGCDSAQGYFFSRPMPATDLRIWLDKADSFPTIPRHC